MSASGVTARWSYPVLEVLAAVVQDVLELDDAVGHEVVVADGRVVEDGQLDSAAVVDLRGELIVPGGAVGLLLGGGLTHARVVHVQGDVRVQEEGLGLGADGVTQGPSRRFELQSLADLDLQLPVEDHHGAEDLNQPTFPLKHSRTMNSGDGLGSTGGPPGRHRDSFQLNVSEKTPAVKPLPGMSFDVSLKRPHLSNLLQISPKMTCSCGETSVDPGSFP